MARFESLMLPAINHLLAAESWALERLQAHAGSLVGMTLGPLTLRLRIDTTGYLVATDALGEPDVSLAMPSDFLSRLVSDRESLFAAVKLSGSAELAESLAFVFRNLRWDGEADLARLVGDIPARRLAMGGRQLLQQAQQAGRRLADNAVDYVRDERGLLLAQAEVAAFSAEVNGLRDDLARLEKRIAALR